MNQWKPIKDAPKDGTKIIGCNENIHTYYPTTVSYRTYHPNAPGKKAWRSEPDGHFQVITHWMELPKPPTTNKNGDSNV